MVDERRAGDGIGRRPFLGMVGLGAAALGARLPAAAKATTVRAYIGNFGSAIALADLDRDSGQLTGVGSTSDVSSPSFLIFSPDRRTLYAVSDADEGRATAFRVEADGGLTVLGGQSTEGVMSTHLALDPSGKYLMTANYGSANAAVLPVNADGSLGALADLATYTGSGPQQSQDSPHPHMVVWDLAGKHVLVPDLGADVVHVHTLDAGSGKLSLVEDVTIRSGAGPRHLVFHPNGRVLYLASELDATVTVCGYDADAGKLTLGQVLPAETSGGKNAPAEIIISADAKFVYVSNRGPNTVTAFAVEADGTRLRPVGSAPVGGNWPRHIRIDSSGRLMLVSNQYSDSVTALRVDPASGRLTPIGHAFSTPTPVCVLLSE